MIVGVRVSNVLSVVRAEGLGKLSAAELALPDTALQSPGHFLAGQLQHRRGCCPLIQCISRLLMVSKRHKPANTHDSLLMASLEHSTRLDAQYQAAEIANECFLKASGEYDGRSLR
jgi:hypothetical protein